MKTEILPVYTIIVGFLPFWWRFWQCINKFYYTKLKAHLWNAGKYFSKMVPPFIAIFYSKKVDHVGFEYYLLSNLIATFYCLYWDYYFDWGLFRSKEVYILRDNGKMNFRKRFYYFAMVANFLLRFFWLINVFNYDFEKHEENPIKTFEVMACASLLAEAIRRSIWALLRIENEFHNNYEAYRSIPTIPKLKDEDEFEIK